jgi:hypothetical protein
VSKDKMGIKKERTSLILSMMVVREKVSALKIHVTDKETLRDDVIASLVLAVLQSGSSASTLAQP